MQSVCSVPTRMCSITRPLILLLCVGVAWANRGFLLTAPKRLLAGSTETICLSLHNLTGTAHIDIDVLQADSDEKIANAQYQIVADSDTCLELSIPQTQEIRGRLHLQARFDDVYDYTINSVKEIRIQQEPLLIFIETDKAIYKPGQEVNFRVLAMKHDFTPVNNMISKVYVMSPSEVYLAQWLDVKTQNGLTQLKFQLSQEPQQGTWKIKVELKKEYEAVHTKTFEVQEYALPRFGVTIKPPDYVLADASYLVWSICAKYSYGQPVKGQLHMKAKPQVPVWRQGVTKPPEINLITELQSKDGCYELNVTGVDLGLPEWDIAPNSITVTAQVTESGTNIVQNATSESTVIHQAMQLEFLPHSSRYFKPGLPYLGKVKVLQPNKVNSPGTAIQLCLKVRRKGEWNRSLVKCKNFTSDADGFVQFLVPPQQHDIELLSFVATTVHYQTKYYSLDKRWRVFMDQPSAFFDVHSWYSPSDSYIEIVDTSGKKLQCDLDHSFDVFLTKHNNDTSKAIHYMVTSRGDIIQSGQLNHQLTEDHEENFNDFTNTLATEEDISKTSKGKSTSANSNKIQMNKLSLSLHILPKMSPLSFLLVFYIRDDGEVVATTHSILTKKCFANKVKAKFLEGQQIPGSDLSLQIEAASNSLCAIAAVDKSTSFIGASSILNMEQVFSSLHSFHIEPFSMPRQSDDVEYCARKIQDEKDSESQIDRSSANAGVSEPPFWDLKRKKRFALTNQAVAPSSKYVDSVQAFDDFGVVVMSDLTLESRPCNHPAASGVSRSMVYVLTLRAEPHTEVEYHENIQQQSNEIRSYFPETWLWELLHVGNEGSLQVRRELPDSITDWTLSTLCLSPDLGLGISPPAQITAFQPFFLDYSMPYSVKRGEILQLKTSLFNYLDYSLPVRISFIDSPGIELLSNSSIVVVCVKEQATFVHSFRIKATDLGEINVTVSAKVDPMYPDECGPELIMNSGDTLVKPLRVEPEGFPVEVTKSSFICPSNFSDDASILWSLELPSDVIEDSARADVSVVGDLVGPALQNLHHLVKLPMGCGEQNMILFVPNIHVLSYLNATNNLNQVIKEEAIRNMEKGYQRELNYRHNDGSYSAFGNSDPEGSMWLTAFVVKSFAQARAHIFIDENDLNISLQWILKRQLENGCFPMVGQVFHKDVKGGLTGETSSSALTAYVLISLLETGIPLPPSVTSNAVFCLQGDKNPDVYTLVLKTYAFVLMKENNLAEEALQHLLGIASRDQDLLWWEKAESTSLGLNVEMTAYAILSLIKIGTEENLIHALKAVRWIAKHRNAQGGFVSTQDTVIGLDALTKYSTLLPQRETALTIFVTATEIQQEFYIPNEEKLLLKVQHLPVLPTQVEIVAEGEGCALIQASLRYNVKTASGSDAFDLDVKTGPVASVDICTVQRVEICMHYKLPEQTSNMAVLEVGMVTGYAPDRTSLHKLALGTESNLKRWEEESNSVNFYFEELSNKRQCIGFLVVQEAEVENPSFAAVKLYDYYQQELSVSQEYSTDAGCKNERLPHPQPNIAVPSTQDFYDEDVTSTTSVDGNKQLDFTLSDMATAEVPTDHLNPQFTNVDHELEVPSGIEGPQPVYVLPQADRGIEEQSTQTSCPSCEEFAPDNLPMKYCNSAKVYKLYVRKGGHARILMDMSPGELPRKIKKVVSLNINEDCSCKPLERAGNHIVMLDSKDRFSNLNANDISHVLLDSSVHIFRIPVQHGQPKKIKQARSQCSG